MRLLSRTLGIAVSGLLVLQCSSIVEPRLSVQEATPFGVCYSKVSPEQLSEYNLVILEPDYYNSEEIAALKATGTRLVAYISLGEVNPNRWYFGELEKFGFLGKNEDWDSFYINMGSREVRDFLVDRAAQRIIDKGFDGFFLDTIDAVAPYTERKHLSSDMLAVIHALRVRYPQSLIIQNAGLFLLEESREYIDAVALEDVATLYDFDTESYQILSESLYRERVSLIESTSDNHNLPVLVIDFAVEEEDIALVKRMLEPLNFPYFISSIALDTLPVNSNSVANKLN